MRRVKPLSQERRPDVLRHSGSVASRTVGYPYPLAFAPWDIYLVHSDCGGGDKFHGCILQKFAVAKSTGADNHCIRIAKVNGCESELIYIFHICDGFKPSGDIGYIIVNEYFGFHKITGR